MGLGEHVTCHMLLLFPSIIKQNWNRFLRDSKATAFLKQQISKFYSQIQRTDDSSHIYVSQWPVINVKASFCADLRIEF